MMRTRFSTAMQKELRDGMRDRAYDKVCVYVGQGGRGTQRPRRWEAGSLQQQGASRCVSEGLHQARYTSRSSNQHAVMWCVPGS